jgi:hypothetical protein
MLVKGLSMLLFGAATVLACEMDCRKGLAGDFAEVYTPVIENSVNGLESSLESSIKAIKVPTILTNEVSEEEMYTNIENAVKKSLKQFVTYATDSKLADGIYRVMFAEELPYKGDCNNPARLTRKMPPQGESWTLEECK